MGLMIDDPEWCLLLLAHRCQAMPSFALQLAECLALMSKQIWTKSHGICGHETISATSRSLNNIHVGLMSDDAEWCWLLVALGCQAMPSFGWQLAESLALMSKSGPKVMNLS
jgi:hypothetical protein